MCLNTKGSGPQHVWAHHSTANVDKLVVLPEPLKRSALFLFIAAELLMPIWARSEQFDNWHPRHIAERYGLLTIIVLGEGILGSVRLFYIFKSTQLILLPPF